MVDDESVWIIHFNNNRLPFGNWLCGIYFSLFSGKGSQGATGGAGPEL